MLLKAKQAALTPSCSSSRSEGVVALSKGSNIPWAEGNYDINYYCCLHNEHLPTIYLCHCIPNNPIYSWKSSYHAQPYSPSCHWMLVFLFSRNTRSETQIPLQPLISGSALWWYLLGLQNNAKHTLFQNNRTTTTKKTPKPFTVCFSLPQGFQHYSSPSFPAYLAFSETWNALLRYTLN